MAIKNVVIEEGCTSCGLCESLCPNAFEMNDEAEIIDSANFSDNEEDIREAEGSCPVKVIKIIN